MAHDKRRTARRVLAAIALVVALLAGSFLWYVGDYYHADAVAQEALLGTDDVEVTTMDDGSVAFVPQDPRLGLVFYPGGKVEPEAYAPLLLECAEQGVLCVLLQPAFNLAILDTDAADGVTGQFPEVDEWYLGGHSLGGVVASGYLADHLDEYEGVVLLAAYPMDDLSDTSEQALCIVGTNDGVLNDERYEAARDQLPKDAREVVIDGGNHAQFGSYGEQDGDGEATISPEEQWEQTAEAIAELAD